MGPFLVSLVEDAYGASALLKRAQGPLAAASGPRAGGLGGVPIVRPRVSEEVFFGHHGLSGPPRDDTNHGKPAYLMNDGISGAIVWSRVATRGGAPLGAAGAILERCNRLRQPFSGPRSFDERGLNATSAPGPGPKKTNDGFAGLHYERVAGLEVARRRGRRRPGEEPEPGGSSACAGRDFGSTGMPPTRTIFESQNVFRLGAPREE